MGEELACVFDVMDDEYMRTRAGDIRDVSERLLRILTGTGRNKKETFAGIERKRDAYEGRKENTALRQYCEYCRYRTDGILYKAGSR